MLQAIGINKPVSAASGEEDPCRESSGEFSSDKAATGKYCLNSISDSQSEILILGSLPGDQSLQKGQYYGNPRNAFWKIMSKLTGEEMPSSYDDKISILKKNRIALWDVLKSAERRGSLDADIRKAEVNDLIGFIARHPGLRVIGFNGKEAMKYFMRRIGLSRIPDQIRLEALPSTSPANATLTLEEKIRCWSVIMK